MRYSHVILDLAGLNDQHKQRNQVTYTSLILIHPTHDIMALFIIRKLDNFIDDTSSENKNKIS